MYHWESLITLLCPLNAGDIIAGPLFQWKMHWIIHTIIPCSHMQWEMTSAVLNACLHVVLHLK